MSIIKVDYGTIGGGGNTYESGTFTTQTSDFDVTLQDSRKPKLIVLIKKTTSYGIMAIYDESVSTTEYRYCFAHSGGVYDNWSTTTLGSTSGVGAGRGGIKSVSEGKFSFLAVSTSGYTGDYQYWVVY